MSPKWHLNQPKSAAGDRTGDPFLDYLKTFKDDGSTDWSTRVDKLLYGALGDESRGQRSREIVAGARHVRRNKKSRT